MDPLIKLIILITAISTIIGAYIKYTYYIFGHELAYNVVIIPILIGLFFGLTLGALRLIKALIEKFKMHSHCTALAYTLYMIVSQLMSAIIIVFSLEYILDNDISNNMELILPGAFLLTVCMFILSSIANLDYSSMSLSIRYGDTPLSTARSVELPPIPPLQPVNTDIEDILG